MSNIKEVKARGYFAIFSVMALIFSVLCNMRSNGVLYNYPIGREDTISYMSRQMAHDLWFSPKLEGRCFPHAFMERLAN